MGVLGEASVDQESTEMGVLEQGDTKCDELQFVIERLVKEATKVKAVNATQFCQRLPERVRETLRNEAKNRVDKHVASKHKIREVKQYITKQRRAREAAADDATKNRLQQRKNTTPMQPPQTVRRGTNHTRKDTTQSSNKEYSKEL